MDGQYDVIVLGLKECVLSGLLSVDGPKVDRNDCYGGAAASLNLNQFMMASGALVRVLIHKDVTKYLLRTFQGCGWQLRIQAGQVFLALGSALGVCLVPWYGFALMHNEGAFRVTKYGLDDNSIDLVGHSLTLHRDDRFLSEPALDTVQRVKLYLDSMARFQRGSPCIYPRAV